MRWTRLHGLALAPLLALAIAACSDGADEEEQPVAAPETTASSEASPEARALLARYLDTNAQDYEACFADLPRIDAGVEEAAFREGGPATGAVNRVMVLLDASGSMAGRVGGQTKMQAAKDAANAYISQLPDGVQTGLVAFGHRGDNSESGKARSCSAVEAVYPLGAVDPQQVSRALSGFDATGWTPLAEAIRLAGRSFAPSEVPGAQVVYVVSDGEETCDGDPVAAARALHEGDIQAVVNIIGFDLAPRDRAQLQAVARAGGGEFIAVDNASELREAVRTRANNVALGRARNRATIQSAGNTFRTVVAASKLSTCISRAWSVEKRGFTRWSNEKDVERDIAREVRDMIDARRDVYRQRADAYQAVAQRRRDEAAEKLDASKARAERDFERAQGS